MEYGDMSIKSAKEIDYRRFPEWVGFNQSIRNEKLIAKRQRPYVYPFSSDLSSPEAGHAAQPPTSNYKAQFVPKNIPKSSLRPTSPTRRHNPQSHKVFHLLRICDGPVCDVTTKKKAAKDSQEKGDGDVIKYKTPLSTSQSAYRVSSTQLSGLLIRKQAFPWTERLAAKGIIPTPRIECNGSRNLPMILPSCKKDVNFMTSQAWKMNPRRRRFPETTNHNWGYSLNHEPLTTTSRSTYTKHPLPRKQNPPRPKLMYSIISGDPIMRRGLSV